MSYLCSLGAVKYCKIFLQSFFLSLELCTILLITNVSCFTSALCEHGGMITHPSFLQQPIRLLLSVTAFLHPTKKEIPFFFSGYEEISKVWCLPRSS